MTYSITLLVSSNVFLQIHFGSFNCVYGRTDRIILLEENDFYFYSVWGQPARWAGVAPPAATAPPPPAPCQPCTATPAITSQFVLSARPGAPTRHAHPSA